MVTLARTATGLLYRSDGSAAGWTLASGVTSAARPSYSVFDPLPVALFGGDDHPWDMLGCRESHLYVEAGTWYLYYDACGADRTAWANHLAVSVDRGRTWARRGPTNDGTLKVAGYPSGGSWNGTFLEWMAKWGSVYYRHKASTPASKTTYGPLNYPLAGGGFLWEIFTASGPEGPWTADRSIAPPGTWASSNLQTNGIVLDAGTYYAFVNGDTPNAEGIATAPNPYGPWTLLGGDDNGVYAAYEAALGGRGMEGAKVFKSPTTGLWVLLGNAYPSPGGWNDRNAFLMSSSLTDWSAKTTTFMQRVCPMDGANALGLPGHVTGPDGALVYDAGTGYVPFVYDTDPRSSGPNSNGWHIGRRIRAALMEPSAACLHWAGAGDATERGARRTLAHSDLSLEFTAMPTAVNGGGGYTMIEYRSDGGTNGYRLLMDTAGNAGLYRVVAGSATSIATSSGNAEAITPSGPFPYRVQLTVAGNVHTVKVNGQVQVAFTDGNPAHIASGTSLALLISGLDCDVRCLSCRTSNTVTVTGMTPGTGCLVRGHCGFPAGSVVADDTGTGTFTHGHFPLWGLELGGVDYTPSGGIWGGDTLTFSGLPSSGSAVAIGGLARL